MLPRNSEVARLSACELEGRIRKDSDSGCAVASTVGGVVQGRQLWFGVAAQRRQRSLREGDKLMRLHKGVSCNSVWLREGVNVACARATS